MEASLVHRGVKIEPRGRSWRWRVQVGGLRVAQSFRDLAEARRCLDEFLDVRARVALRDQHSSECFRTVRDLCVAWFDHKCPRIAPGTAAQYELHIRVHITPVLGSSDPNVLRPRDLDSLYSTLRWKAAKESHNVLRQSFDWALKNRLVARASNPCDIARPSRRTSTDDDGVYESSDVVRRVREKEIPRADDVAKLLTDAEEGGLGVWWLYIKVAATTGARPGEVCALRRMNFDLERRTVAIEWSADKVSGKVKRPKSPWSVRTLSLAPSFIDAIAPALPTEQEAFLFPSNTWRGRKSPLPCWNARSVKRRLDAALARTGIDHFTPHAFRHYVATHLLDQGWPPLQVARFLGHADDSLVRKLYANHIVDETQRLIGEAAARLA